MDKPPKENNPKGQEAGGDLHFHTTLAHLKQSSKHSLHGHFPTLLEKRRRLGTAREGDF